MKHVTWIVPVCLVLVACGDSLTEDMAGRFVGPVQVSAPGAAPIVYTGELVVSVDGNTATVSRICPGGGGPVLEMTGDGTHAEWSGTAQCPPFPTADCSAVTVSYATAMMDLTGDNTLSVSATGRVSGCGLSAATSTAFTGVRQ
jgi:hypothetical protein